MVERKELTNLEIYNYANALLENFNADKLNYPVKVAFYLQKNMNAIVTIARDIETHRLEIIKKYGVAADSEKPEEVTIPSDKINEANKELEDLLNLTQEVSINMMKLDWFDNIDMTSAQVRAISFMIEE